MGKLTKVFSGSGTDLDSLGVIGTGAISSSPTGRLDLRRAKFLGLDAPTKLDVTGLYGAGVVEISAERGQNQRISLKPDDLEQHLREWQHYIGRC
jgi:hypothetical protein